MRMPFVGNKQDHIAVNIKNADTATIPRGAPVVLNMNGTDDGLSVVLPSTAGAGKTEGLMYGVCLAQAPGLAVGQIDYSMLLGYSSYTLVTVMTRSATTASWASAASSAALAELIVDRANNAFSIASTSVPTNSAFIPYAVLVDSIATQAGSASNTSDTRTSIQMGFRAFIRMI
jgi:hypothetical protein